MVTISVSVPDELKEYIDQRVARGDYDSAEEYLAKKAREDSLGTYRQYLLDAGPEVADRFSDIVDEAMTTISESPGIGSLRYAEILDYRGFGTSPHGAFRT